jgi:hypothetical protein
MTGSRSTFTPEFRLEAAQLVVDQGYTVKAAAAAKGINGFEPNTQLKLLHFSLYCCLCDS